METIEYNQTVVTKCPQCGHAQFVKAFEFGQLCSCAECGNRYVIPGLASDAYVGKKFNPPPVNESEYSKANSIRRLINAGAFAIYAAFFIAMFILVSNGYLYKIFGIEWYLTDEQCCNKVSSTVVSGDYQNARRYARRISDEFKRDCMLKVVRQVENVRGITEDSVRRRIRASKVGDDFLNPGDTIEEAGY